MTTIAATPLSEVLQRLVDARLDTIDRMLLGRVNRQDRLAIVREVETQIHDLLQDRDPSTFDREDVLGVLARLDPPEAYLPDDLGESSPIARPAPLTHRGPRDRGGRPRASHASGIVGLVSMVMIFVATTTVFVAISLNNELLVFGGTYPAIGLTFLLGVIATTLAGYARVQGSWAVVGLVTGIVSTISSMVGSVVVVLVL